MFKVTKIVHTNLLGGDKMCQIHYHYHQITNQPDLVLQNHEHHLKRTIQLAYEAKCEGDGGFAAILVNEDDEVVLEMKNRVNTLHDCTAHAELQLVREASKLYSKQALQKMRLYTNCEPCVMCMGAIIWSEIGHVIFGTSEQVMLDMTHATAHLHIPATTLLQSATFKPILTGPFEQLEPLARVIFN